MSDTEAPTGPPEFIETPDGQRLKPLADGEYDYVVLGTGLKECVLSGLLSVDGKKVLHMDRNDYYGGESASLSLEQTYEKFRGSEKPPAALGRSRDYSIDLIPKFIMSEGKLVRMLVHTDVTKYLEFKQVEGSYVYNKSKVQKVPATDSEALKTPLVGFFEKRHLRSFFLFVQDYNVDDPRTHNGLDLRRVTCKELFTKYKLSEGTGDFIGHAMALYRDEAYLAQPALDMVQRIRLYASSLMRYGKSPYIYPMWGLGELPQAFARLSAVYGGVYMLHQAVDKVVFGDDGNVCGVISGGMYAKCKAVVADPSYFPDRVEKRGRVVRAICILSHPVTPNGEKSSQIIIPQSQTGRKSDIYIFCCSYEHKVAANGKYIAIVSTTVETDVPFEELQLGIKLLGAVDEVIYDTYDLLAPTGGAYKNEVYVSESYDPTTHFETTSDDIMAMYKAITNKEIDMTKPIKMGEEE